MDIQSGYYEAGIALFWLLFAYLFMDKFVFRGQLGEICFGKARRRMAKALRGVAGWFDPVKEEQKKGRRRTKGKSEKKEVPVASEPEKRNVTSVKAEAKGKEKAEIKEKAEGRNMEKPPQKCSETDSLVVTKSYGIRQQPPMNATGSGAIAGKENASTFAGRNGETTPPKVAQVPPERIPDLFRDKRVEEWRASPDESSGNREGDDGQRGNGDEVDTDELNEELEDLNCAREDYSGGAAGIGPEEIDLIIDLCNGKDIPTDKRLSLLKAIHHIKDTQIERSILESINGSDSRISKFLDEAEQMSEAVPDSD
ncbi:hypothetical protein EAJ10_06385 [Bacteroides thetaiotaomicron]|uniref:Uncharacterized protein n=1 Tax=Bacteroides thetaiotaomicron TaxID=818 RepID=A0A7J5JCI9_BACT4|nr:hypothetical protein [Bacteroides thetaiotaomicron]KAB4417076.1 hypothetical protein GAN94_19110 [Bacteroides thetaiotaomicron]KAB4430398.1 hypothetical protein GAN87_21550 [Bacteroides thetaiotaomicron]KAB4430818.1 hypothetical protein GAO03_10510 [Bacteroides thetaiotaomicron]KAB4441546.1 hypothetical protein GAN99_06425 [Bacteroides thetaiotaomicron]KAB4448059.1 hypothetical protein GAN93_22725 [Bacteroides thetaiotaomicron]